MQNTKDFSLCTSHKIPLSLRQSIPNKIMEKGGEGTLRLKKQSNIL